MTAHSVHCASCGERVADGALFCPHCGEAIQYRVPEVDPFIGRVVSQRYTVTERIARGGMGEVYLARHAELNQRVAVKFLHRRFADDEEFATRFFNEARSACRVNHPNAVTIYDFGRLEEGTLYIVMEYVGGIPLKDMIQRDGRVGVETALRIGQQAADVLSAAHRQSIVHRDVKPDNVMVMEAPNGRVSIKMLDFGIAKILDEDSTMGSLTQTGVTFGTPEYMSPEQAAGRDVDERSDIYSLGLCMFAMLVGHPPFRGKNKLALLQRHIRESPPALDRACPVPLPAELVRLVGEMLEKDPERRPQSMDVVATRLEQLQRAVGSTGSPGASGPAERRSESPPSSPRRAAPAGAPPQRREKPPSEEGPRRLLTHVHSEPSARHELGGFVDVDPTEAYELGGASAGTDGFSIGRDTAPRPDDDWSIGGARAAREDFAFDDDPYAAPLTRPEPVKPPADPARIAAAVVAFVLLLVVARFGISMLRGASEPSEDGALVSDGSGIVDGSGAGVLGTAAGSGSGAEAAPTDELAEKLQQVLTAIEEGRVGEAEAILDTLEAGGAGGYQQVQNARNRVTVVNGLVNQIERDLRNHDCRAADAKVRELQERYSRRLGMTYWGQLEECRAAEARTSPSQPAPAQPAPAQPAPSQPAPSQPAPSEAAPAQPAPSQPAPSQPGPAQPAPSEATTPTPAPSQPSPPASAEETSRDAGSSRDTGSSSGTGSSGGSRGSSGTVRPPREL